MLYVQGHRNKSKGGGIRLFPEERRGRFCNIVCTLLVNMICYTMRLLSQQERRNTGGQKVS